MQFPARTALGGLKQNLRRTAVQCLFDAPSVLSVRVPGRKVGQQCKCTPSVAKRVNAVP